MHRRIALQPCEGMCYDGLTASLVPMSVNGWSPVLDTLATLPYTPTAFARCQAKSRFPRVALRVADAWVISLPPEVAFKFQCLLGILEDRETGTHRPVLYSAYSSSLHRQLMRRRLLF